MVTIGMNVFATRQTKNSRFSYYDGSEEVLLRLVVEHFPENKSGYKDGVVLVPVPPEGFFSGVVALDEATPLKATFQVRRKGEEPYVDVYAVSGKRLPAKVVDIVLYRHDVLEGDASTDCEWEIVSINARSTEEPEPMTPMAMARNFLELPGATKANYTAEEFARSIAYWSKHAMLSGS